MGTHSCHIQTASDMSPNIYFIMILISTDQSQFWFQLRGAQRSLRYYKSQTHNCPCSLEWMIKIARKTDGRWGRMVFERPCQEKRSFKTVIHLDHLVGGTRWKDDLIVWKSMAETHAQQWTFNDWNDNRSPFVHSLFRYLCLMKDFSKPSWPI